MLNGLKPVSSLRRFWSSDFPLDLGVVGVALIGGIVAGVRFFRATPPDHFAAYASLGGSFVAFIIGLIKAIKNYRANANKHDDSPIEGLLHTIHSILQSSGSDKDPTLRIALYTVDEIGPIQRTHYIGPLQHSGRGRRISIQSGVVGAAFRSGQECHSSLPVDENVVDYLINKQGFTRQEAAERNSGRKSWIAVPIGEPDKVIAVIYCDSAHKDYFGKKNSQRRKVLSGAILGVADFLTRRYS